MLIRRFKEQDAKEVSKLVSKTFNEFVAPNFTKKGVKKFLEDETTEKIIERAETRDVFVAIINNKIIGMIEGRGDNRISRLFVNKKHQRKGVAKRLMDRIENLYKRRGTSRIKVKSSLYAQKFYEKRGYKKTTGLIKNKGMVYQPMKKLL